MASDKINTTPPPPFLTGAGASSSPRGLLSGMRLDMPAGGNGGGPAGRFAGRTAAAGGASSSVGTWALTVKGLLQFLQRTCLPCMLSARR